MRVSALLADKGTANPAAGTLNLLNVGWVQTTLVTHPMAPGALITPPHAVAVFFEAEHQFCNRPIELVLALLDEDARPVKVPNPAGAQEIRIASVTTIPSPAMAPLASPGTGNALIDVFPGLMIPPGSYRWNVTLGGEQGEDWFAAFRVLPAPQAPTLTFGAGPQGPPADPS